MTDTLADLLEDPRRALEVPPEAVPGLLVRLMAVQAALAARLATVAAPGAVPAQEAAGVTQNHWLTVGEAAGIARVPARWIYRHWQQIPGARKLSARCLRFHEGRLRAWLRNGLDSRARRPLVVSDG